MIRILIFVTTFFLMVPNANAWLIGNPVVAGYLGPGDYAPFTAWWGLRCYSAAVAATGTQKALRVRRDSDDTTQDVFCVSTGDIDLTSLTTFCSGVGCWVTQLYDQTNNNACGAASCDLLQATAVRQPEFKFNCDTLLPCIETKDHGVGVAPVGLISANAFTPSATQSLAAVAKNVVATAFFFLVRANGGGVANQTRNALETGSGSWFLTGATGVVSGTAADNTWHSVTSALNSNTNTSTLNIDGTETTATTVTPSATSAAPDAAWAPSFNFATIHWTEGGFQDNSLWSAGTRTALCHNQRVYWTTAGAC